MPTCPNSCINFSGLNLFLINKTVPASPLFPSKYIASAPFSNLGSLAFSVNSTLKPGKSLWIFFIVSFTGWVYILSTLDSKFLLLGSSSIAVVTGSISSTL